MKNNKLSLCIVIAALLEFSIIAAFILHQKYIYSHPKIEVYEVYHKDYTINKNEVVIPIHAGRVLHHDYGLPLLGKMIGDDTGDNISYKNDRYAELTATYWVWKNSKADYVGIIHYRRSFFASPDGYARYYKYDHCFNYLCSVGMTPQNLHKLMQKYDVIMPKTAYLPVSFWEYYKGSHDPDDLIAAVKYIEQRYPEMRETVFDIMNGNMFNSRNMFIMRKDLLDKYAEWLFDVLFHVEPQLSNHDGYQHRAPGFLGERLWSFWIRYQMRTTDIRVGELYIDTQE